LSAEPENSGYRSMVTLDCLSGRKTKSTPYKVLKLKPRKAEKLKKRSKIETCPRNLKTRDIEVWSP
jgi:hypothetical protein